jgi:anti-sigma regulatory factor (Ser/Thr protein kinase)
MQVLLMNVPYEVSFRAVPTSVREARETVATAASQLGAGRGVVDDVKLCVSEAATNIVRHAYREDRGELRIRVESRGDELTVIVRDEGVGLEVFQREGELGHGLRIMERLAKRFAITSLPNAGTEVLMVFPLPARVR